jgi:hypothetical protein
LDKPFWGSFKNGKIVVSVLGGICIGLFLTSCLAVCYLQHCKQQACCCCKKAGNEEEAGIEMVVTNQAPLAEPDEVRDENGNDEAPQQQQQQQQQPQPQAQHQEQQEVSPQNNEAASPAKTGFSLRRNKKNLRLDTYLGEYFCVLNFEF